MLSSQLVVKIHNGMRIEYCDLAVESYDLIASSNPNLLPQISPYVLTL